MAAVIAHVLEYVAGCAGLIDGAWVKPTYSSGRLSRPWNELAVQAKVPSAAPKRKRTKIVINHILLPLRSRIL